MATSKDTAIFPLMAAEGTAVEVKDWYGFKCPLKFGNLEAEVVQLRKATGIIDLSPLRKARIKGPGARAFINCVVTRDISKLQPGKIAYVIWTNHAGKTLADGTLFCFREDEYVLYADVCQRDYLRKLAQGTPIKIIDESDDFGIITVQGPTSYISLAAAGVSEALAQVKPFQYIFDKLGGADVMIARTGFSGDLGYDVWFKNEDVTKIWTGLLKARKVTDVRVAGLKALLEVRAEAAHIVPDMDYAVAGTGNPKLERSPFELGLLWLVNLEKPFFVGRQALLQEKANGSPYSFVGLKVQGNKLATDAKIYDAWGTEVGVITYAAITPHVEGQFALGSVKTPCAVEGNKLTAAFGSGRDMVKTSVTVVKLPFYKTPRSRDTPPLGAPKFAKIPVVGMNGAEVNGSLVGGCCQTRVKPPK